MRTAIARHERVELRPLPRRLFDIETARLGRTIDIDRHDDLGNRRVGGSQVDANHSQGSA